ncbi:MAG: serine/threonine protein kinase, partial [Tannerellaceae bacterium]|nr:serine/threonine protein kinase [Tannerellaceae bacterium]
MNLPSGHLLQNGKYRLTHFVGQGGFGITYKGVWFTEVKGALGTVKAEVPIAIKEYFFKDYCYREESSYAVRVHSETGKNIFDKFKEKLIREARILSDVHHPHIVNVLEVFEENNTAYIAMEYISGMSLKEKMEREGILPEAKLLKYAHQIGEALQFVHDNNILHLDVKPSNILIDRRDNARLIDFGVSKRYDAKQQETSTAMLTLSKGFASIEQYDNEGTLSFSPYPDVYSLGASMYNLLTGRIPVESILRATRPLPEPSVLNPNISPKTESVIMKAMAIVPTDRYPTVREMMEGLDRPPEEDTNADEQADEDFRIFTNDKGDTTIIYPPNNGKP